MLGTNCSSKRRGWELHMELNLKSLSFVNMCPKPRCCCCCCRMSINSTDIRTKLLGNRQPYKPS